MKKVVFIIASQGRSAHEFIEFEDVATRDQIASKFQIWLEKQASQIKDGAIFWSNWNVVEGSVAMAGHSVSCPICGTPLPGAR